MLEKTTDNRSAKKRAGNMTSVIYDQLRSDILNGALLPGTALSQPALAKASGTSRGPVREALRRLQQDQLVIARANQQFSVAPYDISDLESVLCLHLVNVTVAIRVSVPLLTEEQLSVLRRCVEQMEQAVTGDELRWEVPYREFTLTIVKHASPRVELLIADLIDNIQRHRRKTLNKLPSVYSGGPEFREVLAAAEQRDGERTSALYAKFMSRVSALILGGVAPEYNAFRLRGYVVALGSYDKA